MRTPETVNTIRLTGTSRSWRKDACRLIGYIEAMSRPLQDRMFRPPDFHRAQTEFMANRDPGGPAVFADSLRANTGAANASV